MPTRAFTDNQEAKIAAVYLKGHSAIDIAAKLGVSKFCIYTILKRHNIQRRKPGAVGAKNHLWKGGCGTISRRGYVLVYLSPKDPLAAMRPKHGSKVFEHRLVMARALGRPLESHESVHHINGDRQDNRIENLQLRNRYHGNGAVALCRHCGSTEIVWEGL